MEDYPKILKSFRNEQGVTQQELADYMGVCLATIMLWERGNHPPNRKNRKKLEDAMGILGTKGISRYTPRISEEEADLIQQYRYLSKKEILSIGFMTLGDTVCSSLERATGFTEAVMKNRWEVVDPRTLEHI